MLGKNIKTIREYYGESQERLANAIGVAPATISHWESSFRIPKEKNLKKIAQHYRISIEELTRTDMSKYVKNPIEFNKQSYEKCIEIMFPIIEANDLIQDIHFQKGNRMYGKVLQKCKEGKYIDGSLCEVAFEEYCASWEKNGNEQAIANLLSLSFLIISHQILLLKNTDKIPSGTKKRLNEGHALGAFFFQRHFLMEPRNEQEQKKMEERETYRKKFHATFGGTIDEYIRILKTTRWIDLGDYYMAMKFVIGIQHTSFDIYLTQKMGRELMKVLAAQGNSYAIRFIE